MLFHFAKVHHSAAWRRDSWLLPEPDRRESNEPDGNPLGCPSDVAKQFVFWTVAKEMHKILVFRVFVSKMYGVCTASVPSFSLERTLGGVRSVRRQDEGHVVEEL